MRIFTLPGVFQPRSDSWMLADALGELMPPGAGVLDLCTGSGVLAITAALRGARKVTAVDVSRRSVLTVRLNAALNGVRVRALPGDLFRAVPDERFDVVVSNPPYVPDADATPPAAGARRAWDAGLDGRVVLDRICRDAAAHLEPGGLLLLVHSSICGEERTLRALRDEGLDAAVIERRRGRLGPLLAARAPELEAKGLLAPGERMEELLVVGGRRA
jgi:release factor glutamine methyltransferase